MDFLILGLSHKTAPLAVREKIALGADRAFSFLERVRERGVIREALVVSTCNRTEIAAVHPSAGTAVDHLCALAEEFTGSNALSDPAYRYIHRDRKGAEHLLRVSAGLDSLMLGETQIAGQVKEAYSTACRARTAGTFLNRLLHTAFRVAKTVRSTTPIGEGPSSVAAAAIVRLREELGGLEGRKILVVGAGRNADLAARHIQAHGAGSIFIANRSLSRAEDLAAAVKGEAYDLETLPALLEEADGVLSTTSSPVCVITRAMLEKALAARDGRALAIADIAVPRDVEPSAADLPGVRLHDMDSMKRLVEQSLAHRREGAAEAEAIVQQGVESFLAWLRALMVSPVIQELETKMETIRAEELARLKGRFDEEQVRKIDHFSRVLLRRFLQDPLTRIKVCDRSTHVGMQRIDTIRDLFRLTDDEPS